jgi:hypothetical protein
LYFGECLFGDFDDRLLLLFGDDESSKCNILLVPILLLLLLLPPDNFANTLLKTESTAIEAAFLHKSNVFDMILRMYYIVSANKQTNKIKKQLL